MGAKPRWASFSLSVLVHGVAVILLMGATSIFPPEAPVNRHYQVLMLPKDAPKQNKIIWYDFHGSVPEVSPEQPFGPAKSPQGTKDPSGRTLIAQSAEPSSNKQFIWQPDRPQPIPADVPVPNQVAVQPLPPKPVLKRFSPPPSPQAPPSKPQALALVEPAPLVETPKLSLSVKTPGLDLTKSDAASLPRRPLKPFVAPVRASPETGTASSTRLPEAPPSSVAAGVAGDGLKAVIVGLEPAPGASPPGSRPGQFSRAPVEGPPSSGTSQQPGAPAVPGLIAHSNPGNPSAAPAAVPPGGSMPERRLLKDLALPTINRTMSVPLRPSSRIIPASVEARFPGRDVFTLVIPGPSLPEYNGDWILWFSERHPPDQQEQAARVLAPVPMRKYSLTGAAVATLDSPESATIQMASVIDRSGHVIGARILRGGTTGEAFRLKAIEELETWEFQPALRNGEPIEVDVVLEIPFRLLLSPPAH